MSRDRRLLHSLQISKQYILHIKPKIVARNNKRQFLLHLIKKNINIHLNKQKKQSHVRSSKQTQFRSYYLPIQTNNSKH